MRPKGLGWESIEERRESLQVLQQLGMDLRPKLFGMQDTDGSTYEVAAKRGLRKRKRGLRKSDRARRVILRGSIETSLGESRERERETERETERA